jgi:hypothetical protein
VGIPPPSKITGAAPGGVLLWGEEQDKFSDAKLDMEGWVEVVLLAGFRNLKALTSDLAVIVEALRASKYLDV